MVVVIDLGDPDPEVDVAPPKVVTVSLRSREKPFPWPLDDDEREAKFEAVPVEMEEYCHPAGSFLSAPPPREEMLPNPPSSSADEGRYPNSTMFVDEAEAWEVGYRASGWESSRFIIDLRPYRPIWDSSERTSLSPIVISITLPESRLSLSLTVARPPNKSRVPTFSLSLSLSVRESNNGTLLTLLNRLANRPVRSFSRSSTPVDRFLLNPDLSSWFSFPSGKGEGKGSLDDFLVRIVEPNPDFFRLKMRFEGEILGWRTVPGWGWGWGW
jgi:hypothetical protein